jgi:hypothetical protein
MLKTAIFAMGVALALAAPGGAKAAPFTEGPGDAGRLLNTARIFSGDDEISRIDGRKPATDGVDLFQIFIPDTSAFRARVTQFAGDDSQLFLFDENGFGVLYNDNRNRNSLLSRIGSFAGASGLYYLAITGADQDPLSGMDEIFPDNRRGVRGPNMGVGALTGWTNEGGPENTGRYRIRLDGAFTSDYVVSEPSTLGLLGLALVSIAGLRRRKA